MQKQLHKIISQSRHLLYVSRLNLNQQSESNQSRTPFRCRSLRYQTIRHGIGKLPWHPFELFSSQYWVHNDVQNSRTILFIEICILTFCHIIQKLEAEPLNFNVRLLKKEVNYLEQWCSINHVVWQRFPTATHLKFFAAQSHTKMKHGQQIDHDHWVKAIQHQISECDFTYTTLSRFRFSILIKSESINNRCKEGFTDKIKMKLMFRTDGLTDSSEAVPRRQRERCNRMKQWMEIFFVFFVLFLEREKERTERANLRVAVVRSKGGKEGRESSRTDRQRQTTVVHLHTKKRNPKIGCKESEGQTLASCAHFSLHLSVAPPQTYPRHYDAPF